MTFYDSIGVQVAQVFLPRTGIDLTKWAVIACDQYTSQPEYWNEVKEVVGNAPSTFNLILPEVYLGKPEEQARIFSTQQAMRSYLDSGLLLPHNGLIYVERCVDGKTRKGLILCLDLEKYDFSIGSQSLIRATEGTILERLPPRMRIREGASLELPHILVLIDDPDHSVIEPIAAMKTNLPQLYDFDLMFNSGHLSGYSVADLFAERNAIDALRSLADPAVFQRHYQVGVEKKVLLFAVGDGNHSLATAKSIWEQIKLGASLADSAGTDLIHHPARYALVEIENVHDEGLSFEPIHRVLFDIHENLVEAIQTFYPGQVTLETCSNLKNMVDQVNHPKPGRQSIGLVTANTCSLLSIANPPYNLAVGTLQTFLDNYLMDGGASSIDYIHGDEIVFNLAQTPGNAGFYLPVMAKSDLFKTVILDGTLPRKTFSMGEAHQKRFYMECRPIC
jgi:hypothetical protein